MESVSTVFNDPIHGNIELGPLLVKIINTPEFQRLRFVKQLGGAYFVYPGAAHNRFEHSIGTCHLAGKLVRTLDNKQTKLNITSEDVLCVEIAALCHDLGHGPFSHLFDANVIPNLAKEAESEIAEKAKKWKHEQGSIDMLDYMLKKSNGKLQREFEVAGLKKKDIDFIKEMIRPHKPKSGWEYKGRGKDKEFLYEIVSNKRNGIDVDKWDYFARDCHMLGIGNNFNHNRCIDFSRVINVPYKDGDKEVDDWQICFRNKEAGNLYDMFHTRYLLHRRAYQHKTNNIIEIMLAEALVKANEFITFPGKNGIFYNECFRKISIVGGSHPCTMLEAINDMEAYSLLTDDVVYRILGSENKDLTVSKGILQRILKRDLYPFVGEERFAFGTFKNKDDVKEDIKAVTKSEDTDKIIIDLVKLDYGMQDQNPIDKVNFYTKMKLDKAGPLSKEDVSLLLPKYFAEQLVRVYCADKDLLDTVKTVYEDWRVITERRNILSKETQTTDAPDEGNGEALNGDNL